MIENNKIELEVKVLKALLVAAAKNDPRYYLNSIAIKDGFLVSADGHIAARWKFPTESESFKQLEIIIPRKEVEMAISFSKSNRKHSGNKLYLIHNEESYECSFQYTDKDGEVIASTNFLREDCKYVDISKVFKEANKNESTSVPSSFDADYLADLAKMQRELNSSFKLTRIITNGFEQAYIYFDSAFGRFEVLLMPCIVKEIRK